MTRKATKAQIRANCENAKKSADPQLTTKQPAQRNRQDKTTKHTQSFRTAVKSVSYNAVPAPPPAAPPRSQGEAWRPASVAPASKRPAASPGPTNHQSPRSRPACRQPPTQPQLQNRQNRTTKQTQSRRTHLNHQLAGPRSPSTRSVDLGFEIRGFSHPRNHESSVNPPRLQACRVAIPGDISYPHNRIISRPCTRRQSPNRYAKQTQFPKTNPDPHLTATCPGPHRGSPPRPRQSKTTVARRSKRPAAFPSLPSD